MITDKRKQLAVKAMEAGATRTTVAKQFKCSVNSLSQWKKKFATHAAEVRPVRRVAKSLAQKITREGLTPRHRVDDLVRENANLYQIIGRMAVQKAQRETHVK